MLTDSSNPTPSSSLPDESANNPFTPEELQAMAQEAENPKSSRSKPSRSSRSSRARAGNHPKNNESEDLLQEVTAIAQAQVNHAHQTLEEIAQTLIDSAETQAEDLSALILEYPALVLSLAAVKVAQAGDGLGKWKLDLSVPPSQIQRLLAEAKTTVPEQLKLADPDQTLLEAGL